MSGTNLGNNEEDPCVTLEDFSDATVRFDGKEEPYNHRCRACGELVSSSGEDGDDDECQENERDDDTFGPHDPAPVALNWVNHAGVSIDEEDDSVTLHISVGDPRGAFTLTVRRIPVDADNPELAGKLVMHVPYTGEPTPHVPLADLHPGTYIVGS